MTKRADDLNAQAQAATDYSELVKISDSFSKLAERAEVKTKTLKELTNDSNPLTEVNSSAELLEKVQVLSQTLESKTQELSGLYNSNESSLIDSYQSSIAELNNQVDLTSSPDGIVALFPQIESLFKEIEENTRYVSNSSESSTLTNNIQKLASNYADKGEQYSDCLLYTSPSPRD